VSYLSREFRITFLKNEIESCYKTFEINPGLSEDEEVGKMIHEEIEQLEQWLIEVERNEMPISASENEIDWRIDILKNGIDLDNHILDEETALTNNTHKDLENEIKLLTDWKKELQSIKR